MSARFADRLDASTYADDDETVGVFEGGPDDEDALWLSGRLFRRLTTVGAAYELHVLPQLQDGDAVRLGRPQCQSLVDELQFVAERLDDPLAHRTVQTVVAFVNLRLRQPRWDGYITIDGD